MLYAIVSWPLWIAVAVIIYIFHQRHEFDQSPKWRILAIIAGLLWILAGATGSYDETLQNFLGCSEYYEGIDGVNKQTVFECDLRNLR